MEIRKPHPDEWKKVRDIRLRALEMDPDAYGQTLEKAATHDEAHWRTRADPPDGAAFVAVDDEGRFVGMASGAPAPNRPTSAGLFGMWVAPEARRKGIARALIDAVETWARAAGFATIGLGVTTTNDAAIELYEDVGYSDTGERFPLRDDTELVIQIMGKFL
jgi:ribosomal protein S18 acetylase RimI-like enzyme